MTLPKHMPALDGLRGVAILLVILTHVSSGWEAALSIVEDTRGWAPTFTIPLWLSSITQGAAHGVQLFFVISAFTLTLRTARDRDSSLCSYAFRRIARVGPAYWLAGIGYTIVTGLQPRLWAPHGLSAADLAIAAGFGSAWQRGPSIAVVPGGWSVACEVSFYIALPFLVWVIDWRIWRALLLIGLAIVLGWLMHFVEADPAGFMAYVNPVEQAPVFLCGVAAAVIAIRVRPPRIPGAAIFLLGIAVFALPFSPIAHLSHLQFAVVAAVVVVMAAVSPPWILASRLMYKIGEVSYSMYLVHFAILAPSLSLAEWLFPGNDWRTMIIHWVVSSTASFTLSCLTFAVIERPAIRWAAERTRVWVTLVTTRANSSSRL